MNMMNEQLTLQPAAPVTSRITEDTLKNGIKILVKRSESSAVVSISIWVRVGSIYETNPIAGISHFIEHMLFKGTKKRMVGEIAKEIHAKGGYMNAFTDFETTCYWIVLPSKYLDAALEIQSDALLNSTFDETELKKECKVIIEELKMYEDRPESFAFEKLLALAYKKHPYGRPIIGFEESLLQLTRQDLISYFQKWYTSNQMFVTIAGDVNPSGTIRKIKAALRDIPSGEEKIQFEEEPQQQEFRIQEMTGDIARSWLQIGFHVPNAIHPDYYTLRLIGTLLGEGRSSRLNLTLKEKKQLVDNIEAGIFAQQHPGLFFFSAVLEDKNIAQTEKGVWEEIRKLQEELVSQEELLKVKQMAESGYIFSQETVEGQGRVLGYWEMLGDYTLAEKMVENYFKVTPEQIQTAAQKYFSKENCSEILYHTRS
jgi:zinc protease